MTHGRKSSSDETPVDPDLEAEEATRSEANGEPSAVLGVVGRAVAGSDNGGPDGKRKPRL